MKKKQVYTFYCMWYFIGLACLALPGYGQVPQSLTKLFENRPQTIAPFTQQMNMVKQDTASFLEVDKNIDRSLNFGVRQIYYSVFSKKHQLYEISVLASKDRIFCLKLYAVKYISTPYSSKNFQELHSWLEKSTMQTYLNQHNQTYGVHLGFKDTLMLPFRLHKYGFDCGRSRPPYHRQMQQLIREKDEYTLQQWLRSMNVELQAYAIKGLAYVQHPEKIKRLYQKELRQEDKKRTMLREKYLWKRSDATVIQLLKKQPLKIYQCMGCFGMRFTPMSELIGEMGF